MSDTATLFYRRDHPIDGREVAVRITIDGLTNYELGTVLLGFWATMDAGDRVAFIGELRHYAEDPDRMPPLAQVIRDAVAKARA